MGACGPGWAGSFATCAKRRRPTRCCCSRSLVTGLAWYYVRGTVEEQTQVRFDETVQATRAAVDRRTDAYLDALFGARGVFLASKAVEREEWESYVRA